MTVQINGVSLECNFTDADFTEQFENATKAMQEEVVKLQTDKKTVEGLSTADQMRKVCSVVNDYFDGIFGDDTSEQLFGGRNDMFEHLKAVEVITEAQKQSHKEFADFTNKYIQKAKAEQARNQQQAGQIKSMQGHLPKQIK